MQNNELSQPSVDRRFPLNWFSYLPCFVLHCSALFVALCLSSHCSFMNKRHVQIKDQQRARRRYGYIEEWVTVMRPIVGPGIDCFVNGSVSRLNFETVAAAAVGRRLNRAPRFAFVCLNCLLNLVNQMLTHLKFGTYA